MASKDKKYGENVQGRFYVDTECISCDACILAAPNHFKMVEDQHAFVSKQPEDPDEESLCLEAMNACPVEAIGNDCQ